eukprot:1305-Heterococcus_DN1.PRE.2
MHATEHTIAHAQRTDSLHCDSTSPLHTTIVLHTVRVYESSIVVTARVTRLLQLPVHHAQVLRVVLLRPRGYDQRQLRAKLRLGYSWCNRGSPALSGRASASVKARRGGVWVL